MTRYAIRKRNEKIINRLLLCRIIINIINCYYAGRGKNGFAKVSKNLADTDLKIILLDYQNNYVGRSS